MASATCVPSVSRRDRSEQVHDSAVINTGVFHIRALHPYLALILLFLAPAAGAETFSRTGQLALTPDQQQYFQSVFTRLDVVRPTELGLERINGARAEQHQAPLSWDDVEVRLDAAADSRTDAEPFARDLPTVIDNSTLKYFPPIRSQGEIGSCASFATTYYIMTYMTALARDWDVTDDGDANKFSPTFTFNLHNGGGDNPVAEAYVLETQLKRGCPTWATWPYLGDASQLRDWPQTAAVWREAASYRMQEVGYAEPEQLKLMLNNGFVISCSDVPFKWRFMRIKDNPGSNADDGELGLLAVYDRNAAADPGNRYFDSSHAMALVGYNDAVWVDLNGNDIIDDGELGAYKLANSWGMTWGNAGFIWVPYSVFNTNAEFYWTTARQQYEPTLFAEVTLTQASRSSLRLRLGRAGLEHSDLNAGGAVINDCGDIFKSRNVAQALGEGYWNIVSEVIAFDGTFAIDLTDMRPADDLPVRFILEIASQGAFNPTVLTDLRIIDCTNGGRAVASLNTPFTFGYAKLNFFVDTALAPAQRYLRTPVAGMVIYGGNSQALVWETVDGVGQVSLDLYRNGSFVRTIAANIANNGSFQWNVPVDLPTAADYTVRLSDEPMRQRGGSDTATESAAFIINNDLHDFAWSTFPEWVEQAQPFTVGLTARNAAGAALPDYAGTVALAAMTGDSRDIGASTSPWLIPNQAPLPERASWEYPVGLHYKTLRTQSIITAAELGGLPAQITGLELDLTQMPGSGFGMFVIRLRHTALSQYSPDSTLVGSSAGWTTVYNPLLGHGFWVPGQQQIDFSTPFSYDGLQNLMIDIACAASNSYPNHPGRVAATDYATILSLYAYDEYGSYGNALEWTDLPFVKQQAPFQPFLRHARTVPNYRLHLNRQPLPVYPPSITFADGAWSGALAVLKPALLAALKLEADNGVVARSPRFGVRESNTALPALELSLEKARIPEDGGSTSGTVRLPDNATGTVLVYLSSDDPGAATVTPATVELSPLNPSAVFTVDAVDNNIEDANDAVVAIRAGAAGLRSAAANLTVIDDETPVYGLRVFYGWNLNDGDGTHYYRVGTQIEVQAFGGSGGEVFDRWVDYTIYDEYDPQPQPLQIADPTAAKTTITIGVGQYNLNLVEATYKDAPAGRYTVSVSEGFDLNAQASYEPGTEVVIRAGALGTVLPPAGKVFAYWSGDTQYLADANRQTTTVSMPAAHVAFSANWKPAPETLYTLTVGSGSGSGSYRAGTLVLIAASVDDSSNFVQWKGATWLVLDPAAAATAVVMPDANVLVEAELTPAFRLSVGATPPGSGVTTPGGTAKLAPATRLPITATAGAGSYFVRWQIEGAGVIDDPRSAATILTLNGPTTATAEFSAVPSVFLHAGWNTVALPVNPANQSIALVTAGISSALDGVYAKDANGDWLIYQPGSGSNTLSRLEPNRAYWFKMNADATMHLPGATAAPDPVVNLESGWNFYGRSHATAQSITAALGFVADDYSAVWSHSRGHWRLHDPRRPQLSDLQSANPGMAMFVNMQQAQANTPPHARISTVYRAEVNKPVALDGSDSFDVDANPLSYSWTIPAAPAANTATITNPNAATAWFTPAVAGDYTFQLQVNDGQATASASVNIKVFDPEDSGGAYTYAQLLANWQTIDSDGDGVPDTEDLLPYDPSASVYPTTVELEPNDTLDTATATGGTYPLRVTGSIEQPEDIDIFSFQANEGDLVTVTVMTGAPGFKPQVSLVDANGLPGIDADLTVGIINPFQAVAHTRIRAAGTWHLIVEDENAGGAPEFTYVADLFIDADGDGLDDAREPALGFNPTTADTDNDGIPDAAEMVLNYDMDGDGVPNWLDLDSDGDGIPDALEGYADADGDGIPNFLDLDADGNGILDALEAGASPARPHDTDADGIPDFLDPDNDGDGIADVDDPEPYIALTAGAEVLIEALVVDFGNGLELADMARPGDTLLISGSGFAGGRAAGTRVLFYLASGRRLNVAPTTVTATAVSVVVPFAEDDQIRSVAVLVDNAELSPAAELRQLSVSAPIVLKLSNTVLTPGDSLTLNGINLEFSGKVVFGDHEAVPTAITADTLTVTVPAAAVSGFVQVVSEIDEPSNYIYLQINRPLTALVAPPAGATVAMTDLRVYGALTLGEQIPDAQGIVSIAADVAKMDYLKVTLIGNQRADDYDLALYLMAPVFPGETTVTIDPTSTAVAMVLQQTTALDLVAPGSWTAARGLIRMLPELQAYKTILEAGLLVDPFFLLSAEPSLASVNALFAACDAAMAAVTAAVANGELIAATPPAPESAGRSRDDDEEVNAPVISPAGKFHDIAVEQYGDTGFVRVINDTQLYLSSQIVTVDGKRELVSHVKSMFDPQMVGPQGWGILFWAGSKVYDQKEIKKTNCRVNVCTPGLLAPYAPDKIHDALIRRTFVERIMMPIVNSTLGEYMPASKMLLIMTANLPVFAASLAEVRQDGKVHEPFLKIVNAIIDDATAAGPMTQALAAYIGGPDMAEQVAKGVVKKIAAAFIPGFGSVRTVLSAVEAINTTASIGLCISDIMLTPGLVEFEVVWTMGATRIHPPVFSRKSANDDSRWSRYKPGGRVGQRFNIHGAGFAPIKKGWFPFNNRIAYPVVELIDSDPDGAPPLTLEHGPHLAVPNGNMIEIQIPWAYLSEDVKGDFIHIRITHDEGALTFEKENFLQRSELDIHGKSTHLDRNYTVGGTRQTDSSKPVQVVHHRVIELYPEPGTSFPILPWEDYQVQFTNEHGDMVPGTVINNISSQKIYIWPPEDMGDGQVILSYKDLDDEGRTFWRHCAPFNIEVLGWEVGFDFGDSDFPATQRFSGYINRGTRHQETLFRMPYPMRSISAYSVASGLPYWYWYRYLPSGWHSFTVVGGNATPLHYSICSNCNHKDWRTIPTTWSVCPRCGESGDYISIIERPEDWSFHSQVFHYVRDAQYYSGTLLPYNYHRLWFETGVPRLSWPEDHEFNAPPEERGAKPPLSLQSARARSLAVTLGLTPQQVLSGNAEKIIVQRYGRDASAMPIALPPERLAELRSFTRDNTLVPLPARIGGTFTYVGGAAISDSATYSLWVTRPNGTVITPTDAAVRRTDAGWYILDIPIFDAATQPNGAAPGETLVLHAANNGVALAVTSPANGLFQVGTAASAVNLDIALAGTVDIDLKAGWNLVSLPLQPLHAGVGNVFNQANLVGGGAGSAALHTGPVWVWNGNNYDSADSLNALQGAWVYVMQPAVIRVPGMAVGTPSIELHAGWNLIGPPAAMTAAADARLPGGYWHYNRTSAMHEQTATLQPGYGYWVNALTAFVLQFNPDR